MRKAKFELNSLISVGTGKVYSVDPPFECGRSHMLVSALTSSQMYGLYENGEVMGFACDVKDGDAANIDWEGVFQYRDGHDIVDALRANDFVVVDK